MCHDDMVQNFIIQNTDVNSDLQLYIDSVCAYEVRLKEEGAEM